VAEGIPVSYQENGWLKHFFRILGVLALMGGIALAQFMPNGVLPGVIFACLAVFLLVANEFQVARQKAAERSVVDTGSGFRWLGGPAEIEVQDADVEAVRLKRTPKFLNGAFKGVIRRFEVWTAGAPSTLGRDKPMCMTNRIPLDAADPLAPLIARVTEDLKQRTAAGLAGGAMLEGDGWRLAASQLSVDCGRSVETLPFVEIDKVAVFDGKICLWRRGQDGPAARISPDSKNALVLGSLMTEWIEHQRGASKGPSEAAPGASGLGRLLFERRLRAGFTLAAIFSVLGGVAGAIALVNRETRPLGIVLLAGAAVLFLLGMVFGRALFRCYELGLVRRGARRELRLLYDEITEFTYGATRTFHNGAYAGTMLSLTFRAPRGTVRYAASVQNMDADLDELRDHVAGTIAARMLRDLRAGRVVRWMDDVVFLPQGLQFRRSKMLGLAVGSVAVLPYEQIRGMNCSQGVFHLFSKGEVKAVLSKPVGAANFFPGYFVISMLLEPAGKAAQGPAAGGAANEE
jgi:hypothetical protein